jgi:hypothetical protein
MQVEVPDGWRLFLWSTQEWSKLVVAPDEEQAYEAAIRFRQEACGQTREEAEGWFQRDDCLDEVPLPLGVILAQG